MPTLFGMPGRYQAPCPIAADYTLFDHAQARRLGAGADPEYVGRVMANRHDPGNRTGFAGRIVPGTQRYQNYGGHLSVYFEEFFSTSVMHKEAWIYQSEWASSKITPPQQVPPFVVPWIYDWAFYTPGHPPSYRDFGAWHAANWLRRGFGLYFDNSMPKRALDPVATSAFQREDGQVVPSCGIWAHREYLKRIWVLHQQFYNPHTPQIMMIHMTNTHILPYHVWNQVNLDLEWKFRVNALFQKKFGHDLLRAESLGLQTGNYPTAMAGASKADAAWLKLHAARYERTRWAGLLVHEIKGGIPLQPYPKLFEEVGYGLDDAHVFNYWDRRPVLHVNDPEVKWLLVERQGRALLLVCTWNPEPASLVIDVDSERLGFTPQQASDAEADTKPDGRVRFGEASETMGAGSEDSDEPKIGENWRWDASRNRLSLPMPGYGVRIALLE